MDFDLAKGIMEEFDVTVANKSSETEGTEEVHAIISPEKNTIVFESKGVAKDLSMNLDEFLEYFGKGYSSISESQMRQIIRSRVPTFLKISDKEFKLKYLRKENSGKLTEDERKKLMLYREFFSKDEK